MNPKVAVVGAGYWGKNLVRNFYQLGNLAAICDESEQVQEIFSEQYPDTPLVNEYNLLLADESIDAVVLATPAETHYRLAKMAIQHGKHVFVEKPLALHPHEAEELGQLAEQQNRVLMVGHILQYHPAVLKLRQLVNDGEIGQLRYIYSNRLNMGKIRSEENILWSFAPHDISVILMLLNEMPSSITSHGGCYLQPQIADTTLTVMDFSSSVKAHIFVSWLHPFKEQKLVVVGDHKMAVFDDTAEHKLVLYPHKVEWQNRIPVAAKADAEVVHLEMVEPLKAECRHFLDCIENGSSPRTDGREGLRVLQVLEASQQSLDKPGTTIKLGMDSHSLALSTDSGKLDYFVHESSYIDDGVKIGSGTRIWHFSHVMKNSVVGRDCRIGQNVVIGPKAVIGDNCKIQNNVSVFEGVIMEDHVFCGPSMVFTNVFNPRAEISRMDEVRPTLVKQGATIGANATIVCGHTIGVYSFIGAGAVVTMDIPDYALITGNPGKITGWMCRCGNRLTFVDSEAICTSCGRKYRQSEGLVLAMND